MRVSKEIGPPRPRPGFLIPRNGGEKFRLPSFVVDRTFERGIWRQINFECGSDIDEYEGITLEPSDLVKAAKIIRQDVGEDKDAPDDYVTLMIGAAEVLENSARRDEAVMFSL
jgi:hypothetical protein